MTCIWFCVQRLLLLEVFFAFSQFNSYYSISATYKFMFCLVILTKITRIKQTVPWLSLIPLYHYADDSDYDDNGDPDADVQSITYNWSAETRSLILGSFYYGYAISQLPGGLLCSYCKPQHLFGLSVSISGLLCLMLPFVAQWNVSLLITSRFLMGIMQVWRLAV